MQLDSGRELSAYWLIEVELIRTILVCWLHQLLMACVLFLTALLGMGCAVCCRRSL